MINSINILALFVLIWAEAYLILFIKKPIKSISLSFYLFEQQKKSHYFVWYTWGVGLPLLLFSAESVVEVPQFLHFGFNPTAQICFALAGFFLALVGIASTYKVVATMHYIFAVLAIGLGFAGITAQWGWPALIPFAPFAICSLIIVIVKLENRTYWIERVAQWAIFLWLILVKP